MCYNILLTLLLNNLFNFVPPTIEGMRVDECRTNQVSIKSHRIGQLNAQHSNKLLAMCMKLTKSTKFITMLQ